MFISRIDIKSFHIDATLIPGNETKWSDFLAKTRTSITSKEGGGLEELVCCFLIRSHFPRAANYETTISNTPSLLFFVLFSALIKESLNDVEHTRSKLQITSEITIKYPFTGFCFEISLPCLVPVRLSPRPSRSIDFRGKYHVTRNEWPRRNIEAWELGKPLPMFDEALSKLAHNRQTPIQTSNFCCVQSNAYMMNDVHVLSRRKCGPAKEKKLGHSRLNAIWTYCNTSAALLNFSRQFFCKILSPFVAQHLRLNRQSHFCLTSIEMNSTRQKCDVRTRFDLQFYIIKYIRYYSTFFMFSFLKLLFGKRWKLHFRVLKNKIPHRPPPLLGDLITPFTLEFRKLKQRRQRRQRRRPAKFAVVEISYKYVNGYKIVFKLSMQ